jgi:hypothetical protein
MYSFLCKATPSATEEGAAVVAVTPARTLRELAVVPDTPERTTTFLDMGTSFNGLTITLKTPFCGQV